MEDPKPDTVFEVMIFVMVIVMVIGPLLLATWLEHH